MGELGVPFFTVLNSTELNKSGWYLRCVVPNRHNRIPVQHALITAWVKWVNLGLRVAFQPRMLLGYLISIGPVASYAFSGLPGPRIYGPADAV